MPIDAAELRRLHEAAVRKGMFPEYYRYLHEHYNDILAALEEETRAATRLREVAALFGIADGARYIVGVIAGGRVDGVIYENESAAIDAARGAK